MYSGDMKSEGKSVRGVSVHVKGAGPSVVLLHANGGSHHDFDAVSDALATHSKVFAIDWPGHGESADTETPAACAFADLLPSVLEDLNEGPYTLIGNSVGGFAAIRTAAERPDLVRDLVVVNPGGFTPRWPGTFITCWILSSKAVSPVAMRLLPRLYLRRETVAVRAIRSAAVDASRNANKIKTFASIWRSFTDRRHDARADAANISCPVMLIWGTRDPILPWFIDGRRARRAFRDARVVTLPCGHQSFAEMPEAFTTAVADFLGWDKQESS